MGEIHAEQVVREFAETFKAWKEGSRYYQYLLDHLDSGTKEPLTKDEQAHVKQLVKRVRQRTSLKHNQCFCNAQTLTLCDITGQTKYHEGVIIIGDLPIPINHAWNTINGKIVDVTATANEKHYGRIAKKKGKPYEPLEYTYCGMTFEPNELRKAQLRSKVYCDVLPWVWKDRKKALKIDKAIKAV